MAYNNIRINTILADQGDTATRLLAAVIDVLQTSLPATSPVVGAGTAPAAERVVIATDQTPVPVQGAGAHLAALAGNPVLIAGRDEAGTVAITPIVESSFYAMRVAMYFPSSTNPIPGDAGGVITKPFSLAANDWRYAAATGGISNTTTAVTIKAAHATLRNHITGLQLSSDALGVATELAIRDGAGGTVLWRMKITTAGLISGMDINFAIPLRGSVNTLLEIVTLTASVTGAVFVNTQGFVAA